MIRRTSLFGLAAMLVAQALAPAQAQAVVARTVVAPATGVPAPCARPSAAVEEWPLSRSPGLTLRVPPGFQRDAGPVRVGRPAGSSRWADSLSGQLMVWRVSATSDSGLFDEAGRSTGSRRCEARVGSATAVIVSFDGKVPAGGAEALGPFQARARIRWPDGEIVEIYADAVDRRRFDQLLAALRTIRRAGA